MWNLATAPAWSDLIHVTLWRNNGLLQSFYNCTKSNAFGENFIRTKFILHKIFFRMSILPSKKTSLIFFSLFWKNCEKLFVHFEGKGVSGNKNQYKLFCKKWVFKYFLHNNLKKQKKNYIFQNKLLLGGMTIFRRMGCRTTKINITFSMGNGVPNTAWKFFPQKPPYSWMKAKKLVLGAHFPPISLVLVYRLFPKNKGFIHVWTRTNRVNFMKIGSKLRPVSWL